MPAAHDILPDRIRPLRRVEYEALVQQGLRADARVELPLGTLVDVTPQALAEKVVEVHRHPASVRYTDIARVGAGGELMPAALREVEQLPP